MARFIVEHIRLDLDCYPLDLSAAVTSSLSMSAMPLVCALWKRNVSPSPDLAFHRARVQVIPEPRYYFTDRVSVDILGRGRILRSSDMVLWALWQISLMFSVDTGEVVKSSAFTVSASIHGRYFINEAAVGMRFKKFPSYFLFQMTNKTATYIWSKRVSRSHPICFSESRV